MGAKFDKWERGIQKGLQKSLKQVYSSLEVDLKDLSPDTPPSPEQGDMALGCFRWTKTVGENPAEIAKKLAGVFAHPSIQEANAMGPYLNLKIKRRSFFQLVLEEILEQGQHFGPSPSSSPQKIMLEYSAPNTNKPMHLGHVRNNTLGMALGNLLKTLGHQVILVNLVNDRGIHICKSMVAYQKWGGTATPKKEKIKGDHFVGQYYVRFNREVTREQEEFFAKKKLAFSQVKITQQEWVDLVVHAKLVEKQKIQEALKEGSSKPLHKLLQKKGVVDKELAQKIVILKREEEQRRKELWDQTVKEFQSQCPLLQSASRMLKLWEDGDPEVRRLWKKMNGWVYDGFDVTYERLGCSFDLWNYESKTYKLGKKVVEKHLSKGVFYQKEDQSIWAKLQGTRGGFALKDKLVLRKDGTSVYITQDLGTAVERFEKHHPDQLIYVVASEQNLHFATLFEILSQLGYSLADRCFHAAYGMVTLPQGRGKLKSRDGTTADADQMLDDLESRVKEKILEGGFYQDREEVDQNAKYVALGALKLYLLHVSPQKNVQFDPDKAIEFTGDSGPSIQYSYTRIQSIYRKSPEKLKKALAEDKVDYSLLVEPEEWELVRLLFEFPQTLVRGARDLAPSHLANYLLSLTKTYARFFSKCQVLKAKTHELQKARLQLCMAVAVVLKRGLEILAIPVPEKM